jgi:hypothetical protein
MKLAPRAVSGLAVAALIAAAYPERAARAADPTTVDCLSASENSLALRNQHQLRAARAQLLVCAHANCPADVRRECTRRVAEINTAMPTVVFEAKDAAGNDVSAVKVSMDGQPLVDRLEGTALSIDPGEHSFTFESPGQPAVQKKFVIREGEKDRREVVALGAPAAGPAQEGTPTPGTPAPAAGGGTSAPPGESGAPSGDTSRRTAGFIVGGVGLAGVGVGITLLVLASSLSDRSDSEDAAVPGSGHSDHEAAVSDQLIGLIVGGVGVAALGVGAVLVLTGSGHQSTSAPGTSASVRLTPLVGPQHAGLGVSAIF